MITKLTLRLFFAVALALFAGCTLSGCLIVEGGFSGEIYLAPGESINLHVGVGGCCYFILPLDGPALWSIDPNEGATIGLTTGLLTIAEDTPNGTTYTVSSGGQSATVYVYDPAQNPLAGDWRESHQIACGTGEESAATTPVEEFIFEPNGQFSVTWIPFEVYRDYWGTYTVDLENGTLEMTITDGNHIPETFDGIGTFEIAEDGTLILRDIWLGSPFDFEETTPEVPGCGHRFTLSRSFPFVGI